MAKLRFLGREIEINFRKRLYGIGSEGQDYALANLLGTDTKAFARLDAYSGPVYSCINLIAETYASYQPYIERRVGKDNTDIGDHEFLRLLKNPGGLGDDKAVPLTLFDTLYATAAFIELQADCYWYMPTGNITGKPREIIILRADKVGKVIDKDSGDIIGYFVRTANGGKIPIDVYEMLPFIGFDPKNPYQGKSTTEAAADFIETDASATKFTKNFFKNNAGLSGILTLKGDIGKPAFRKFVRLWRDKYENVDNAGKVMMVRESDAAFEKIGLGLNELDMGALRKMSLEDIAMMFRVPIALLGKGEQTGLGRANVETFEYIFAKYTIEPKMKKLDAVLQFALQRYWKTTDLYICHEEIIPEDKEYELNRQNLLTDKVFTRNEMRGSEGLGDVPGGNTLYVPINQLPLGEAAPPPAADSSSNSIKLKIHRKIIEAEVVPPAKKKVVKIKLSKDAINSVNKENFRLRLMRNQTIYERKYIKRFKPILVAQRKEAKYNLEAHASNLKTLITKAGPKLFDDANADKEMLNKLMPTLINLGQDQGALALVFAGDTETKFRMTAPYLAHLQRSTQRMAGRFNDDTIEKLNVTLAEGIQAGEALGDLKKRVDQVYDGAEGYRSLRVARTETLKASNSATEEAYTQTGYVNSKQWVVNPDACPQCEAFDGKEVGLGETFAKQGESYDDANGDTHQVDYEDVETPPLHPNCRCTIIPVR